MKQQDMDLFEFQEHLYQLMRKSETEGTFLSLLETFLGGEVASFSFPSNDESIDYALYLLIHVYDGVFKIPYYIKYDEFEENEINLQLNRISAITDSDKKTIDGMHDFIGFYYRNLAYFKNVI